MKTVIYLVIFLLTLNSCKDLYDTRLIFTNESDSAIYVTVSDSGRFIDTAYVLVNYDPGNFPEKYKVSPNESKVVIKPPISWDRVYEHEDTLAFYIFDAEVIESLPWSTIKSNYMVLERYDLTLSDLEYLNWEIKYP